MLFTVILNDTNQTPVVVVAAVVVDAAAAIGLCMLYVKSSSEKKPVVSHVNDVSILRVI